MAERLGITAVHLSNIENGKAIPSPKLLSKYQELWGIDLYVLAWCDEPNSDQLPPSVRAVAGELRNVWSGIVEHVVATEKSEDQRAHA